MPGRRQDPDATSRTRHSRRLLYRFLLIVGLLSFTLAAGTIGFAIVQGDTLFDAFYRTVTTITTTGNQELTPLHRPGEVFNAILILFGVTAMFLAVGAMTQTIIELELQDRFGKRRMKRMIQGLHEHVIVCGFGRVGRHASFELQQARAPFVVLDRDETRVTRATGMGMIAMALDATRDQSLREAGVEHARGLIAALPSDAENLFIILSAKALNPKLRVVTRVSEEEAEAKLRRAGADTVLTPYALAGNQMASALLRPHVVEFLNFEHSDLGRHVSIEQVAVAPQGRFESRTLGQLMQEYDDRAMVLAVRSQNGAMRFHPAAEYEVVPGDCLIVMGEREHLEKLEKALTG
jgi:voltage-gated potassium channel